MEIINSSVTTTNGKIPYTLIKKVETSSKLAVILPGAGYTAKAPLLHYSTGVHLSKGYDVLHVNYQYSREVFEKLGEEEFAADVQSILDDVFSKQEYDEYVFVAKSLGTIALSYLLEDGSFEKVNAIWLTPLLQRDDVFQKMAQSKYRGLVIIGDDDPCYIEERYEELGNNPQLQTHLIKGTNHALEFSNDVVSSVDALKEVVKIIDSF